MDIEIKIMINNYIQNLLNNILIRFKVLFCFLKLIFWKIKNRCLNLNLNGYMEIKIYLKKKRYLMKEIFVGLFFKKEKR